jgi:hypothetical protein
MFYALMKVLIEIFQLFTIAESKTKMSENDVGIIEGFLKISQN